MNIEEYNDDNADHYYNADVLIMIMKTVIKITFVITLSLLQPLPLLVLCYYYNHYCYSETIA